MSQNTVTILGIKIISSSTDLLLKEIIDFASVQGRPKLVFTPNPEFLVEASRDSKFRELLSKADINLPDGVGLVWASRVLGTPIKERISGADVVERLIEMGNKGGRGEVGGGRLDKEVGGERWTIGIAGARRGDKKETEELIKKLQQKYPNIIFVNLDNPNFKSPKDPPTKSDLAPAGGSTGQVNSEDQVLNVESDSLFNIHNSRFNVVFACQGMKKQEQWIWENKDEIKASVFVGIGGSLDFLTGFSQRAPRWMRKLGLEWFWRGLQRPGHWRRIWKAVVEFGWLVIKERLSSNSKS